MDEQEWIKWSWKNGAVSAVVFEGPGWLAWCMVTATSTKKISVTFHNGSNSNGDVLLHIHTITGDTKPVRPHKPIRFDRGCFVSIDGDTEQWHAQYKEDLP